MLRIANGYKYLFDNIEFKSSDISGAVSAQTSPVFMQRSKMFFSVIVPVYNIESYLAECLDSLMSQTCRDMEIIVVDDGSTDGSGNICDKYADKYDFITVIHQGNQGLSAARNTGLRKACGDWIVFVDGDGKVGAEMLEVLESHILASKADMYRLSYVTVDESGDETSESSFSSDAIMYAVTDEKTKFDFYFKTFFGTVRVWGGAYRRSIIEEYGIQFEDTKKVYAEDLLFNFQYMLHAQKIVYLKDVLYFYRKREGSLTDITGFGKRLIRSERLGELAYKSVADENLSYFKRNFYRLYFRLLNRFIMRDGADFDDSYLCGLLKKLDERKFHRDCKEQIRRHSPLFKKYTNGREWYRKDFGSERYERGKERRQGRPERLRRIANRFPFIWHLIFTKENLEYIVKGTTAFEPVFVEDKEQKAAYLSMPKAACTSITASVLGKFDIPDDYSIFKIRRPYCTSKHEINPGWFTFTFVRNPFERLVSCYESKYHVDITKNKRAAERGFLDFDRYLHGYIKDDNGFTNFVDQIVKIPWRLDNKHFASQYRRITDKNGNLLVNYIGKFEHLSEDYEPIREKYGFAPLKVYNKSEHGDWRDYYTTDLVKKVYRKYRKDVEYFGYEQDYKDLLEYCENKERQG